MPLIIVFFIFPLKLEQCSASTLHKEIEKLSRQWCTKTLEVNMLKREYETLTSEKEANVSKMYQLLKEESKTLELLARQGEKLGFFCCCKITMTIMNHFIRRNGKSFIMYRFRNVTDFDF